MRFGPTSSRSADRRRFDDRPILIKSCGLGPKFALYLDATKAADLFKQVPYVRKPYVSDYIYQPPLIAHQIRHYELSTNANKWLSCHSFKNSVESGATKISVTHYATRDTRPNSVEIGWVSPGLLPGLLSGLSPGLRRNRMCSATLRIRLWGQFSQMAYHWTWDLQYTASARAISLAIGVGVIIRSDRYMSPKFFRRAIFMLGYLGE